MTTSRLATVRHWLADPLRLQQQSLMFQRTVKRLTSQCFSLFAALVFFAVAMHVPDAHALMPATNDMVPTTVQNQGSFLGKSAALATIGIQLFCGGLAAFVTFGYGWAIWNTFGEARAKREWGHFGGVFVVGTLVLAAVITCCITGITYATNLVSYVSPAT